MTKELNLINEAEKELKDKFNKIDEIAYFNFKKVINAFQKNKISTRHFQHSTGYGYDDISRDTLSKVFADVFFAEDAIVSPLLTTGTQTIKTALFGLLLPGDKILSISGKPYDTLMEAIEGTNVGSLKDYNISFEQIDLLNGDFNNDEIIKRIQNHYYKVIFLGRSRGYELRNAISIQKMKRIFKKIKEISKNSYIVVDNCYGEFVTKEEPLDAGCDIMCGSLIKNPGGSLAPTGGYIVGKKDLIRQISFRFTSPGLGMEVGSYENTYRLFFQGLFLAPSIVANALKGSLLFALVFNKIGIKTFPNIDDEMNDIVRSLIFNTKEELIKFCQIIQNVSPVDSYLLPLPWDMPGYKEQVIMAAGSFVQGSSIELSCDAPIKEPYIAYIQGGISYEHVKFAVENALKVLL